MKAERIRDLVIFLREGSMHRHEDMEAAAVLEMLLPIVEELAELKGKWDEQGIYYPLCERALKALS